MNTKQMWIVVVVVAIVFGGAGFFGGMKYQQSKVKTLSTTGARPIAAGAPGGFAGGAGRRTGGAGAAGAGFSNGQVLSVDNSSITIKLQNGGSQIVVLAPSTQYRKAVDGTSSDVSVGSMVTVTGSTNSDGSLTAQSVQIRTGTSTPPSGFTPPAQ